MDGSQSLKHVEFSSEEDFEGLLLKLDILKDMIVINYKNTLNYKESYDRYADVLIIDREYKYWGIGEVEISKHSFVSHIFPQLIELYLLLKNNHSEIKSQVLTTITESKLDIDKAKVQNLILSNEPFLFLLIDRLPVKYSFAKGLLKSFCNVITVNRMKDGNETFHYLLDYIFCPEIQGQKSSFNKRNNILFIKNPDLIKINNQHDKLHVKSPFGDFSIHRRSRNHVGGFETFYIMKPNIKIIGKHYLKRVGNDIYLD